jgi:hypothetical protein
MAGNPTLCVLESWQFVKLRILLSSIVELAPLSINIDCVTLLKLK